MADVLGAGTVFSKTYGYGADINRILSDLTENTVREIQRDSVELMAKMSYDALRGSMSSPKNGTHWPGLPNRSSRPGQTPAVQWGLLINSMRWKVNSDKESEVAIGRGVPYAFALEYGNPSNGAAPRPMMRWIATNRGLHKDIVSRVRQRARQILRERHGIN